MRNRRCGPRRTLATGWGDRRHDLDARVGRKRDHRNLARARDLTHGLKGGREEWPENDLHAFVQRLLGDLLGGRCVAGVVARQHLDIARIAPSRILRVVHGCPTAPALPLAVAQGPAPPSRGRCQRRRRPMGSRWVLAAGHCRTDRPDRPAAASGKNRGGDQRRPRQPAVTGSFVRKHSSPRRPQ